MVCAILSDLPTFVRFPGLIFLKKMQNLAGTTEKYSVLLLPRHMNHSRPLSEDPASGTATLFLCLSAIFHKNAFSSRAVPALSHACITLPAFQAAAAKAVAHSNIY